ncbi:hypothetical protein BDQ17DRAFT_947685 [Cyathus striatus]|nr:hypothetical protein BDQ17DRAFT_947685 [Cyathus striatus]
MILVNAACPGAGHESAERADPPKCHPETRKKFIDQIMKWIDSSNEEKQIMWFNGPAGAGKSAISQTIAERCSQEGKLLSSFFFSRTATGTGRDDGARLIPTIAYHLAIATPEAKDLIIDQVDKDPAMFHHSMEIQLKKLVTDVIGRSRIKPYVVIIDGLDECSGSEIQSRIIKTIAGNMSKSPYYLQFLIVSRPERDILKSFDLQPVNKISVRLSLNVDSSAYEDIRIYLRSEFELIKETHTLAVDLSKDPHWPPSTNIWELAHRSSGHFIYASVVMKYIASDFLDPREALQTIIHKSYVDEFDDNPYAHLDSLYGYILSSAAAHTKGGYDVILPILQTLLVHAKILSSTLQRNRKAEPEKTFRDSTHSLAEFLGIKESVLQLRLAHLRSIIHVPASITGNSVELPDTDRVKFHHASFGDYLLDPLRSGRFFVDPIKGNTYLAHRCLAITLDMIGPEPIKITGLNTSVKRYSNYNPPPGTLSMTSSQIYALEMYFHHMECSKFDDSLLNEFRQKVNVGLLISFMLSHMNAATFMASLKSILIFDLSVKDFTVPKADNVEDIGRRINEEVDQFLLKDFIDAEVTYVRHIEAITFERKKILMKQPLYPANFCWTAAMMENPTRGRHIYLSSDRCKFILRAILRELWKIRDDSTKWKAPLDGDVLGISLRSCPLIIAYLLERIEVSLSFGLFLQENQPFLKQFLAKIYRQRWYTQIKQTEYTLEIIDRSISTLKTCIYDYLKKCSLIDSVVSISNETEMHTTENNVWGPIVPDAKLGVADLFWFRVDSDDSLQDPGIKSHAYNFSSRTFLDSQILLASHGSHAPASLSGTNDPELAGISVDDEINNRSIEGPQETHKLHTHISMGTKFHQ